MQSPTTLTSTIQLWNFLPGAAISCIQVFITFKLLKVARFAQRLISNDYHTKKPIVESCGYVNVNGKIRVRLMIFNMRSDPIKIDFIAVANSTDVIDAGDDLNTILSNQENTWFKPIVGANWNPKGTFDDDDDEHSFQEGCRYLHFKDVCEVLITIPDFDESTPYAFIIQTTNGGVIHHSRVSNTFRRFPTGGERIKRVPKEIQG